jgi:ferredoxin--NADP+ reductase
MFKILDTLELGPKMHYVLMDAPMIARKAQAGQFVMVRVSEKGERVPLTIADYDRKCGTVTLVFQDHMRIRMHEKRRFPARPARATGKPH